MPVPEPAAYGDLKRRLYVAGFMMLLALVASTAGYYVLGGGRWTWFDCFYMTIITLGTVGYGETLEGMADVAYARAWTAGVILGGSGILLYWVSAVTAILVEGDLGGTLRRRRMDKAIAALADHVVLCGAGTIGVHAARELRQTRTPCVVVDRDEARLQELASEQGEDFLYVVGAATDDESLLAAGIVRAKGVLVMLHDDRDNLFCTLSARSLNSRIRIVSKAVEHGNVAKLMRAGADRVVSPNFIGGMRLASEMIRPTVVEFLDTMLRGDTRLRIEEVPVTAASGWAGRPLGEGRARDLGAGLLLAVREPGGAYRFNPASDYVVPEGATLIVMAHLDDVHRLGSSA